MPEHGTLGHSGVFADAVDVRSGVTMLAELLLCSEENPQFRNLCMFFCLFHNYIPEGMYKIMNWCDYVNLADLEKPTEDFSCLFHFSKHFQKSLQNVPVSRLDRNGLRVTIATDCSEISLSFCVRSDKANGLRLERKIINGLSASYSIDFATTTKTSYSFLTISPFLAASS